MADSFNLRTDAGSILNASIEIDAAGIILHSRSGTERNRDYKKALVLLMGRLDKAGIDYEIYLDSRPSQQFPLEERRLIFDREAPLSQRFDQLVRAMNAGSASNGAWRRLLIATSGRDTRELAAALDANSAPPTQARLPAATLRKVTSAHIHKAVGRLLAGADAPDFAPSRDYDVLTDDGVPLAPKKVFGLALEDALGIQAHPSHFSAGWGQICFELLEKAGLWIVPKAEGTRRPLSGPVRKAVELSDLTLTEEELSWIEGNPKIVSHLKRERAPGLAQRKRTEFIAMHGKLYCEDCMFDPIEKYGHVVGSACIEVHHHRVHVAAMSPGHRTTTDDLKCLCANCHRVLHRKLTLGLAAEPH